jgi:Protein of unknown function (DUF2786)
MSAQVIEKVRKLLALADRAGTEAEAANAAAAAQRLLAAHNLDAAAVDGPRAGDRVDEEHGTRPDYDRLWSGVADLHFCLLLGWDGRLRMVGRLANVRTAVEVARYLEGAIERILRERAREQGKTTASRWARAFREGAVDTVLARMRERRRETAKADEAAARSRTGRELTLTGVAEREAAANADHVYGEGWSARQAAEAAERRATEREADEAFAAWARANPEAVAAEEERRRWEARAAERARSRRRAPKVDLDALGGYASGTVAGRGIGLDPQVAGPTRRLA